MIGNLDYEEIKQFTFNVIASDNGDSISLNASCNVEIEVLDVNDNSPKFNKRIYTGSIRENSPLGTKILQIKATDADSEHFGRVSYTLKSDNEMNNDDYLSVNDDGWILLNKDIDYEKVLFSFLFF